MIARVSEVRVRCSAVTSVEKHGTESVVDQADVGKLLMSGGGERYEVEWDAEAKVTPMGSLVFFAQYLQTTDRCAGATVSRLGRR